LRALDLIAAFRRREASPVEVLAAAVARIGDDPFGAWARLALEPAQA